jgi:hypothetical protein
VCGVVAERVYEQAGKRSGATSTGKYFAFSPSPLWLSRLLPLILASWDFCAVRQIVVLLSVFSAQVDGRTADMYVSTFQWPVMMWKRLSNMTLSGTNVRVIA